MDNKIITGGGLMPSTINTPIDVRTRVETVDDIYNIELPYVGMIVYVIDEDKYYRIKSLKDKIFKGETEADYTIIMQDAIVDTFEKFNYATEDMVIALQQEVAELRALIEELKNSSTPSTPSTPSGPATGDNGVVLYVVVALFSLAGAVVMGKRIAH